MLRKTIATIIVAGAVLAPTAATATPPPLEEGATFFEDGSCVEADGSAGQAMIDGTCMTIADYNALYSYENLASTPSIIDDSVSIAEEAGLVDDGTPPALRPLGDGVTAEPHRFVDLFAPETWVKVYNGYLIV